MDDELFLTDFSGGQIPLSDFQDPPTFLVFFSSDCKACGDLVDRFRWWPDALPEGVDLQPVFVGSPEEFLGKKEFSALVNDAWYDRDHSVTMSLRMSQLPGGTRIDAEHPTGNGGHFGVAAIEALVTRPGYWDEPQQKKRYEVWKQDLGDRLFPKNKNKRRDVPGKLTKVKFPERFGDATPSDE